MGKHLRPLEGFCFTGEGKKKAGNEALKCGRMEEKNERNTKRKRDGLGIILKI
jgi:hypothetical protein